MSDKTPKVWRVAVRNKNSARNLEVMEVSNKGIKGYKQAEKFAKEVFVKRYPKGVSVGKELAEGYDFKYLKKGE